MKKITVMVAGSLLSVSNMFSSFALANVSVVIDILPNNPDNEINPLNPDSKGSVPIAILTTNEIAGEPATFDATLVMPYSLQFGPGLATIEHEGGHFQDVDNDGDMDLLVHFSMPESGVACRNMTASLTGETVNGVTFSGSDYIKTVGCKGDNIDPVANNSVFEIDEDFPVSMVLTGSDANTDALTFSIVSGPVHGVLSELDTVSDTEASLIYTPAENRHDDVDFVFQVADGFGGTAQATVTITINPVNDAPTVTGTPPGAITGQVYSFTADAADVENDDLSFSLGAGPAWLSIDPLTGELTGVPSILDLGQDNQVTIEVSDGQATTLLSTDIPLDPSEGLAQTAADIRREAIRTSNDPAGHPLPLISSWQEGFYKALYDEENSSIFVPGTYLTPEVQLGLIEQGYRYYPCLAMGYRYDELGPTAVEASHYERAIRAMAALQLPICIVSTQYERVLSDVEQFSGKAPLDNPNVIQIDDQTGELEIVTDIPDFSGRNLVSPFGPVQDWYDAGRGWTENTYIQTLQDAYPEPPQVMLLSNNEHRRMRWIYADRSYRYLQDFKPGEPAASTVCHSTMTVSQCDAAVATAVANYRREVVASGWTQRYQALLQGLSDGLTSSGWQDVVKHVGYRASDVSFFARWPGWPDWSLPTTSRFDSSHLEWDGGSVSYYQRDSSFAFTDYRVVSPQIEHMNTVMVQQLVRAEKPDYWFEMSVWDGYNLDPAKGDMRQWYSDNGQTYTPIRYKGYVQYGMWLLRPRVVREFRGWLEPQEAVGEGYLQVINEAVNSVHEDADLRRFWEQGNLLANLNGAHPYQVYDSQTVPPAVASFHRWFGLDTDLDPPRPWSFTTEIPVYALAYVIGDVGSREWLIYAHSPRQDRNDVVITVPGYGDITLDVTQSGVFHVVSE